MRVARHVSEWFISVAGLAREMLGTMRVVRHVLESGIVAVALVVVVAATNTQQATPPREPASKAAAILTWPPAQR